LAQIQARAVKSLPAVLAQDAERRGRLLLGQRRIRIFGDTLE